MAKLFNVFTAITLMLAALKLSAGGAIYQGNGWSLQPANGWVAEFAARKRFISSLLREIPGVAVPEPRGSFYIFPNFSAFFGRSFRGRKVTGSADLAAYLLDEGRVATIPGAAFGSDSHLRLSFALSRERIETGVQRVAAALAALD